MLFLMHFLSIFVTTCPLRRFVAGFFFSLKIKRKSSGEQVNKKPAQKKNKTKQNKKKNALKSQLSKQCVQSSETNFFFF